MTANIKNYLSEIQKNLKTGQAGEHTYRPALKTLIESFEAGISAINEPKRVACGAPDFIITKKKLTVGYIETKDIGKSLDEIEKSEQLKRYRTSLSNLILTDYLEFRRYVNGERAETVIIGECDSSGKVNLLHRNEDQFIKIIQSFLCVLPEKIKSPKKLAVRMAQITQMIRDLINAAFEKEQEKGTLHSQYEAFREILIQGLRQESFADLYSQTIAYGLFAARCNMPDEKEFTREHSAFLLPKTNPFLRKLFNHIAGPDLDDRIAWLVDDLAQLLSVSDIKEILKDFGVKTKKEDPVVHFYETFLAAYDSKLRESRGVYYTPEPVVSFIVRSLDSILKKSFRRPQGLADSKTFILDPACGTGTFLYSVIKLIYDKMEKDGQKGVWDEYVAEHLLKRVFGFELLMAPYTVAHLKLGLLLQETGYKFDSDQRLGIYLTNTLSEAEHKDLPLFAQFIAEESAQAARVKNEVPIMAILGNPPYSGISANMGKWITKLIDDYKFIDGKPLNERKVWLQDDYVKFIRFAQWKIDRTGQGVVGIITNHAYLDNPTFRGMRQSLLNTFSEIYILNLHGNAKKKEKCPDGTKDENVFDIQQGVAINLFVKKQKAEGPAKIYYADLWGTRDSKYEILSENDINKTNYKELSPNSPYYFFIPRNEEGRSEYEKYWKITDIFPVNCTGIVTARDKFVIDFEKEPLKERIECFRDKTFSDIEIKEKFKLSENYAWRVSKARAELTSVENWKDYFDKLLYRPFDTRNIYYHPTVVWRVREKVMRHMLFGNNVALYLCRQLSGNNWRHILATNSITDDCYVSNKTKERGYIFPLYLYPDEKQNETESKRQPNIKPEFVREVSGKLKLDFVLDGQGDLKKTFGPEDIFYYIYAVFHSPEYRKRYAEFLKIDFPRAPLTSDRERFKNLVKKGKELVSLHLMESPALEKLITRFPISGKNEVVKVNYEEKTKRIYINKEQYFEGIEPAVWNFYIGGYQVLDKWLKSRKGRFLTFDEVLHWQKIVVVLKETSRLMTEIDQTTPQWPIK